MSYALQFIFGLLLLAIFGPPWLLMIGNAACGDWLAKRRMERCLAQTLRQRRSDFFTTGMT